MAEVDWPLLRREKASLVPSGDQVGCQSVAVVNTRPLVPSALMTWMPPFGQTANAISLMRSVGGGGGPDPFTTMSPPKRAGSVSIGRRSEEHTSELQSQSNLVCRL